MTTITRGALYAQVWAQPMTALAPTYGLSAATLKTLCDRYDVPTPRGGYWQKKSAGRAGAPRPLPTAPWPADQVIDLAAPPPKPPRPIAKAVRPRPSAAEALTAPRPKPTAQPSWTPSTHEPPAVRALRKALERAKPTPLGFLAVSGRGLIPAVLSEATRERALAWLSRFLEAANARGMVFAARDSGPCLVVAGQEIPFRLEEKSDKHPHAPTPAELRRKAERAQWSWASSADPWPKYDHRPSGRLSIQLEGNAYSGLRRSFADGQTRTLEALIEDVLDAAVAHADYRAERERQAEIARRQAEIERRRRERREAFNAREQRRDAFLALMSQALDRRAAHQRLLDHIDGWASPASGPPGLRAYVERRLAEEDARLSADFVEWSARSAKLEFDEARARAAPPVPSWQYPSALALQLWREESDRAVSMNPLEWLEATGRLPALDGSDAGEADEG